MGQDLSFLFRGVGSYTFANEVVLPVARSVVPVVIVIVLRQPSHLDAPLIVVPEVVGLQWAPKVWYGLLTVVIPPESHSIVVNNIGKTV